MVEGLGDDIVLRKLLIGDELCQRVRGGDLHFLVDIARAHVERAAKDAREGQNVVDLVRVIAPAGRDDLRAARLRVLRKDLRRRVRAGEDDRILVHGFDHLGRDGPGRADADEHICADEHIGQASGLMLEIRDLRHLFLDPVETLTPLVDRTLAIAHRDVPEARGEQQLHDRDGCRAGAGGDDPHVLLLLADDLQCVGQAGQRNDGGAVLIVVEDGDIAALFELAFDLKASGRGNILKVDAAERAGDERDGIDEFVHIMRLDAQREGVDVAEGLEEHAFALHDRHTGLRADIAETEDGRAVGDDGAEVPAAGQLVAFLKILLDLQARLGDARRVGERQIVLRLDRHTRRNFDFSLPFAMQTKRFFCVIHVYSPVCYELGHRTRRIGASGVCLKFAAACSGGLRGGLPGYRPDRAARSGGILFPGRRSGAARSG